MAFPTESKCPGELVEYHAHRNQKNNFRYFCLKCMKNFESPESVKLCRRCGHNILHELENWTYVGNRERMREMLSNIFHLRSSLRKRRDKPLEKHKSSDEELPTQYVK